MTIWFTRSKMAVRMRSWLFIPKSLSSGIETDGKAPFRGYIYTQALQVDQQSPGVAQTMLKGRPVIAIVAVGLR